LATRAKQNSFWKTKAINLYGDYVPKTDSEWESHFPNLKVGDYFLMFAYLDSNCSNTIPLFKQGFGFPMPMWFMLKSYENINPSFVKCWLKNIPTSTRKIVHFRFSEGKYGCLDEQTQKALEISGGFSFPQIVAIKTAPRPVINYFACHFCYCDKMSATPSGINFEKIFEGIWPSDLIASSIVDQKLKKKLVHYLDFGICDQGYCFEVRIDGSGPCIRNINASGEIQTGVPVWKNHHTSNKGVEYKKTKAYIKSNLFLSMT
jgi:hypothetical protein